MAHISYVQDTIEGCTLLPDYADGRIIRSDRKNYLMHPPLYYSALGAFSRITDTDPFQGHVVLRILSACLVGAGFLFWLLAFRNFNLTLAAAVIGTLATCAIPIDRKSVVEGKSVSVRVDLGGRRIIKKKKQ